MKGIETLKRFVSGTVDLKSHKEVVNIDGSSTVYPITKVAARSFRKQKGEPSKSPEAFLG
jgi:ABC-type phosphate transport system substrate-binding protein